MLGLKFGRLPPILSVQLKRFVYDFSGPSIVQKKLNDQVKFPMILDMNKYVATKTIQQSDGQTVVISNEEFEAFLKEQLDALTKKGSSQADSAGLKNDYPNDSLKPSSNGEYAFEQKHTSDYGESLYDVGLSSETDMYGDAKGPGEFDLPEPQSNSGSSISYSGINSSAHNTVNYDSMTAEEVQQLIKNRGEWIYELYAVLIHSGAITGGHYFAYIKDLDTKKWWSFNDSNVTPIEESTVREAWGGPVSTTTTSYGTYGSYYNTSYYSTPAMSNSNAYMLMYRKVCSDASKVVPFPSDDMVPEAIKKLVRDEEESKAAKLRAEQELRNRLLIKIHWNNVEHQIQCKKTDTYEDFLEYLWNHFKLEFHCCSLSSRSDTSCSTQSMKLPVTLLDLPTPPISTQDSNDNNNGSNGNSSAAPPRPDSRCSNEAVGDKSESSEVTTNVNDMNDFCAAESVQIEEEEVSKFSLFRLRHYNSYSKVKSDIVDFESSRNMQLGDLLFSDYKPMILETRRPEEDWELFFADGCTVLLQEFDSVTFTFKDARSVRFKKNFTVRDLKNVISKWVSYPEDCIQVLKITNFGIYDAQKDVLVGDDKPVGELCTVCDPMKLIFEYKQSMGDEIRSISSISTATGGFGNCQFF